MTILPPDRRASAALVARGVHRPLRAQDALHNCTPSTDNGRGGLTREDLQRGVRPALYKVLREGRGILANCPRRVDGMDTGITTTTAPRTNGRIERGWAREALGVTRGDSCRSSASPACVRVAAYVNFARRSLDRGVASSLTDVRVGRDSCRLAALEHTSGSTRRLELLPYRLVQAPRDAQSARPRRGACRTLSSKRLLSRRPLQRRCFAQRGHRRATAAAGRTLDVRLVTGARLRYARARDT